MSESITVRLDDIAAKKLRNEAKSRKLKKSEIVREALIQHFLVAEPQTPYAKVKEILEAAWADTTPGLPAMDAKEQEEYLRRTMGRKRARPT